jgi:hypothetical protein
MKQASWILAVALMALSGAAVAQTLGNSRIVAQVPFEFVVANKIMPAGEWSVQSAGTSSATLMLRNHDQKMGVFANSNFDETKHPATSYALVFKRYADQYFLSSIRLEGTNVTYRLLESKAEAEIRARNVTGTEKILRASLQ